MVIKKHLLASKRNLFERSNIKKAERLSLTRNNFKALRKLRTIETGIEARHLLKQRLNELGSATSSFWRGEWNKDFMINMDDLSLLKDILTTRRELYIKLFNSESPPSHRKFPQIEKMIMDWILVALPPSPNTKIEGYCYLPKKLINEKYTPTAGRVGNTSGFDDKKGLNETKNVFSQTLGDVILKSCLDDFKVRYEKLEGLFTTLNLLISFGNDSNLWDLCFCHTIIIPHQETNPLADPNLWKRANKLQEVLKRIEAKTPDHFDDLHFIENTLKSSLLVDSYILQESIFGKVIRALNNPETLERSGSQILIRLTHHKTTAPLNIFIAPYSELFYRQYLKLCADQAISPNLSTAMPGDSFFTIIGQSKHTSKLEGFKSWEKSTLGYLHKEANLSGLMISYALGNFSGSSLNPDSLKRQIYIDNMQLNNQPNTHNLTPSNLAQNQNRPRTKNWTLVGRQLQIHHIKKHEKYFVHKGIQTNLIHLKPKLTINEKLFTDYAIELIDNSLRYKLSPSEAKKAIDAIGIPLMTVANQQEIVEMSANGRQALYYETLELEGISYARVRYFLRLFENWFIETTSTSSRDKIPDYDELLKDAKKPAYAIDANIINFDEYFNCLDNLISRHQSQQLINPGDRTYLRSAILLIMGFRLDLRRSEGLNLFSKDFVFDLLQPDLIIKPHENRTLKTPNAERTFHLEEHLNEQEIQILIEHYDDCIFNVNDEHKYFLSKNKTTEPSAHEILQPVLDELHKIDKSLKYHNLRHSKATWDMLSIVNAQFDLKIGEQFFNHAPKTSAFLKDAKARWTVALHNPSDLNRAQHFLRSVMGHGSLQTTLRHYIHFMDLAIAALQTRQSENKLSINWVAKLQIKSRTALHEDAKKKSKLKAILDAVYPLNQLCDVSTSVTTIETALEHHIPQDKAAKTHSSFNREYVHPLEELTRLNPFCFYLLYALHNDPDKEVLYAECLSKLKINKECMTSVLAIYEENKYARFKPLNNEIHYKNLLNTLLTFPADIQQALLDESFFYCPTWASKRELFSAFVERLNIKLITSKDTLSPISEYYMYITKPKQAEPIIKLLEDFGLDYTFKLQAPKSKDLDLAFWQNGLALDDQTLNKLKLQKSKVLNPDGRVEVIVCKPNQNGKYQEFYRIASMICMYKEWITYKN